MKHTLATSVKQLRRVDVVSQGCKMDDLKGNIPTKLRQLFLEIASCPQGSKSCLKLCHSSEQGLGREEAWWFLSLPDKVQRQCFTKEEHIFLKAACEITLKDMLDETYWTYGTFPCMDRLASLVPEEDEVRSRATTPVENWTNREDASSGSFLWPAVHGLCSHESVRSQPSSCSAQHSRSRSHSSTSRNFSLPFNHGPGMDHTTGKVTSWLANTVSIRHEEPLGSKAQFYQDPETRLKLRRYTSTPEAFDEALEFGFLSKDNNTRGASTPDCVPETSSSHPYGQSQEGRTEAYLFSQQEEKLRSSASSRFSTRVNEVGDMMGMVTPGSVPPGFVCARLSFPQLRVASSVGSLRSASTRQATRDMTFRMTLTRPELGPGEEDVYHVQQEYAKVGGPDPWALERLPVSDDVTGKHGAFASMRKENKIRKVWRTVIPDRSVKAI
ncbi:hypothetical protein BDV97DRAFT_371352 [Delphinella strobiligena]|nr:hypothetical protein BDV97DRAFT_371352 [Delphinella strobiligena]